MAAIGRVATWVAVAALGLNALFLGVAGVRAGRPQLLVAGGVAGLLAVGVVLAWRGHQRRLEALQRERRALRDEALALRELVRRGE